MLQTLSSTERNIDAFVGPLMQVSWSQTIDEKDPKNKNLEQLLDLIKEDGKLRMPKHHRELQLLKAKGGCEKHSDFLHALENLMSVAEFKTMTSDEMIIHLFTETADNTMSRLSLKIIAASKPSVTKLRRILMETENSI